MRVVNFHLKSSTIFEWHPQTLQLTSITWNYHLSVGNKSVVGIPLEMLGIKIYCSWLNCAIQVPQMVRLWQVLQFRHSMQRDTVFTTWLHLCAIPWIYNTRFVIGVAETIDSNGFFTLCLSLSLPRDLFHWKLLFSMVLLLILAIASDRVLNAHAVNMIQHFIKLCDEF